MRKGSETNTYKVYVIETTGKAILCTLEEDEEGENEFWLPMSQIEVTDIDHKNSIWTVDVPDWLAEEKGMV